MNTEETKFTYVQESNLTILVNPDLEESLESRALKVGSIFIGKYKILEVLGEGSFSIIYLLEAMDISKKLLVAKEFFPKGLVKRDSDGNVVIKTSLSDREKETFEFMKKNFLGEAENLSKISSKAHSNVLNFFSLETEANNTLYLITSYENGTTLKNLLNKMEKEESENINQAFAEKIASGIIDALHHIHSFEIYHQDIKLENILIRNDGSPLLLDFGASKLMYDEKRKKYFNAITPKYASPEQAILEQPPKIDQRSDIYSLGVLLYRIITGTFPPTSSERVKSIEMGKGDPYIPLVNKKMKGYKKDFLEAIDKSLNLKPEKRFQNALEFRNKFNARKSKKPTLLILSIIILTSIVSYFVYLNIPISKGIVQFIIPDKEFMLYIDGHPIKLNEEKSISLPIGEHEVVLVKEGYLPIKKSVYVSDTSINTLTGTFIPLEHKVKLFSNHDSATFIVNGKLVKNGEFNAMGSNDFNIIALAPNMETIEKRFTYLDLFNENFEIFFSFEPIKKEIILNIKTNFANDLTKIFVNNKLIDRSRFTAVYNNDYNILISNPYYIDFNESYSFDELNRIRELEIVPTVGKGKLIIEGLPKSTKIVFFQLDESGTQKYVEYYSLFYKNRRYYIELPSHNKYKVQFFWRNKKFPDIPYFSLKNGDILNINYKEEIAKVRQQISD